MTLPFTTTQGRLKALRELFSRSPALHRPTQSARAGAAVAARESGFVPPLFRGETAPSRDLLVPLEQLSARAN